MPIQSQGGIFVALALSHCRIANVANLLACRTHAAATASRHRSIVDPHHTIYTSATDPAH
jgi:hypothetical protein